MLRHSLEGQNSDVLDLKVGAWRGARRVRAGVLGHSAGVASANLISITRFSCGGSILPQQNARMVGRSSTCVAVLVHRAGNAGVVRLVAVVLSAPSAGHARPRCGRSS